MKKTKSMKAIKATLLKVAADLQRLSDRLEPAAPARASRRKKGGAR